MRAHAVRTLAATELARGGDPPLRLPGGLPPEPPAPGRRSAPRVEDSGAAASVLKLLWSRWHQELGELAMDVLGAPSLLARGAPYDLDDWQRLFLFSRADTIYGGSDEIQRIIIAERALGLPRLARS